MPLIQAVTFDVGGTLLRPWPSVGHVYARLAREFGMAVSPEVLNERFAAAWKAKTEFHHSRQCWKKLVIETFASFGSVSEQMFALIYDAFKSRDVWQVEPDLSMVLTELRKRNLPLGIISNWDERLRPLLDDLDLTGYFNAIVISCEYGQPKPAPGIFQEAARRLNVPVANILHVGDSFEEDIQGAGAAGMQTLQVNSHQERGLKGIIRVLDEQISMSKQA